MSAPIYALMTDNSDGTYSYTINIANPGNITIGLILYIENSFEGNFYYGGAISGTPDVTNTSR